MVEEWTEGVASLTLCHRQDAEILWQSHKRKLWGFGQNEKKYLGNFPPYD